MPTSLNRKNTDHGFHNVSPSLSLNDNVTFLGKELHVQTEIIQYATPYIRTHIFSGGQIIHTVKYEIPANLHAANDFKEIRDMTNAQHREVMSKINKQQAKYHQQL